MKKQTLKVCFFYLIINKSLSQHNKLQLKIYFK